MSVRKRFNACKDDTICASTKPKRNRVKSNPELSIICIKSSSFSSDDSDVQIIESDDKDETQKEENPTQVIDIDDADDTNDTSGESDDVTIIEDDVKEDVEVIATSSRKKPIVDNKKLKKADTVGPQWDDHELLAEQFDLELDVAKNIVNLFTNGNTIPFIARYRKKDTNYMTPEMLRAFKESFEEVTTLKSKIAAVVKQLDKTNVLNDNLLSSVTSSRSIEELEYIFAPYKPGNKRSLAERAKELGLEQPAHDILYNLHDINLERFDKKQTQGIIHIISSIISSDTEMLASMRKLRSETNFTIKVTKHVSSKQDRKKVKSPKQAKTQDESKFKNYFDFTDSTWKIKSYKVMAINRGEAMKILSVKVIIPEYIQRRFKQFCRMKWTKNAPINPSYTKIIEDGISDAYTRSVQPHLIREIRAELKLKAERASCEVFNTNLKNLLLGAPLKGKPILGIDPGYSHGCKLALVSPTGSVLDTNILYLFTKRQNQSGSLYILKKMLTDHNCDLIALGNGTGCRKTEEWLTNHIKSRAFDPIDVKYTIVNEDGASIYSCSPEAQKEFPNLDPNIISAVSLARRVQDPLAELVKIEPKHLGVGMYQHDLKKKQLDEVLADVVSECVSFVGVDLNTTSKCLLKYVAGMSDKRAQQIIQHRETTGPYTHRKQLIDVYGIGPKIFEQCAGFLRVANSTHCKFDSTDIHPESYEDARKLIEKFNLRECDVGEKRFIEEIQRKSKGLDLDKLSVELETSRDKVDLILEALSKVLNYDLRITGQNQERLFRKDLTRIEDLQVGTVLTGRVSNVTDFGCFVDVGVGQSGMIHISKFFDFDLKTGMKVEVRIINLEINRGRIHLVPLKIL